MVSNGARKMDELFQQIWSLEQGFADQPSVELAETLVNCLSQVGNRGYFNPVLKISWMPYSLEQKLKTYQGYIRSDASAGKNDEVEGPT
jgi:hypothetical protein